MQTDTIMAPIPTGQTMNRPRAKEPDKNTATGQFSLYLAHLLERRNMSADDIARESGLSRTTIFNWLRGDRSPSIDQLEALAVGFKFNDWRKVLPTEKFIKELS